MHGEVTGSIGIRLLDAPAAADVDPRARLYIVDHVAPGTVVRRRIEVANSTGSTMGVSLYPSAAAIANGSFVGAEGHTPNELSTWTTVTPGASDLPPAGRLTATVVVTVPRDAAPGEQYGVVWAETRATPASGTGITQVSRVGIRLYLSVGPGGAPAADFTIESLTAKRAENGQPLVVATVRNTGGRALDMSGSLRLEGGPGGLSAGPFAASLGTTLAIGATSPVRITLDKRLPAGPWDARITLKSGLLERTAQAMITFPAQGAAAPVRPRSSSSGLPLVAIAFGCVLLALALWLARRLRRRPRSGQRQHDGDERLLRAPPVALAEVGLQARDHDDALL